MPKIQSVLSSTALALVMLSVPSVAQDDAGAPVRSAYEAYAAARVELDSKTAAGESAEEALQAAARLRSVLEVACADAGTPDLANCLETHVPADSRIASDLTPLPDLSVAVEAETAGLNSEEDSDQAVEQSSSDAEAGAEQSTDAEEVSSESEAAEQLVMEEEARSDDVVPEPAEVDQVPAENSAADAELSVEADAQVETQADAEVNAEADETVEPNDTPMPDAEVEPVSEGASVQAAYAAYADARAVLREARAVNGDVASAIEAVNAAHAGVESACADIGTPDLAACLDMYVSADFRLENDLQPMAGQPSESLPDGGDIAVVNDGEPASEATPIEIEEPVNPEDVAPVLDSAKEEQPAADSDTSAANASADTGADAQVDADAQAAQSETADATQAPPQTDEEAQSDSRPQSVRSVNEEQGEPVEQAEAEQAARNQRAPQNARVVEENEFRIVFQFGDQLVVRNRDNTRLGYDATDRQYERLVNGRTRETITRENGSQLITIYNRNGDILRRSVIEPDGSEYVLVYTPEDREDDLLEWRDPGQDLPPLVLNIPTSEYVLDARTADEQRIYEFLRRPPVERVSRLYSVDEVKRSARVRDSVRRLEIGDLTFETGSAALSAEQFGSLAIVAEAMKQLLEDNPAELFLIEGHTDAVGSDVSNLALSDRRAETVAIVLTQTFGIPPENMATQGYGERYLAIRTQGPERLNRRVTVKRITPLVSPAVTNR